MFKPEDEEWTVAKLRMLLGRHLLTTDMAGSDYESSVMPAIPNPIVEVREPSNHT